MSESESLALLREIRDLLREIERRGRWDETTTLYTLSGETVRTVDAEDKKQFQDAVTEAFQ